MNEPISMFRPTISEAAIAAAGDVLRSGWFGTGRRTAEFERAFSAAVGAPHCVGTAFGTDALVLGLTIADVRGRDVILPSMTFVAAAHAIVRVGGKPVFADIDVTTGNIDPASVEERITERTAAILVVHHGGLPADLAELRALADAHDLRVLEDCAHATGATYRGAPIGAGGDLHAFSFQATKNLTAGGGGAVTFVDSDEAAHALRLRGQGVDRDYITRRADGLSSWDYLVVEVGLNCAMSDVHAAIGLVQLELLAAENERRAAIAARYRELLASVPGVELLATPADRTSSNYLFILLAEQRDALMAKLALEGIETSVHFRAVDTHPVYERADLPGADWFWHRCLSLPVHLALRDADVERVCEVVARGW